MAVGRILTTLVLLGAIGAAPAFAQQRERRGDRSAPSEQRSDRGERARPRADVARRGDVNVTRRTERQVEVQRQVEVRRQTEIRRDVRPRAPYRGYNSRTVVVPRTVIVPRYVRPHVVTVAPYRPYVYRPRLGLGVYYGANGAYPYGYTPRGYYDPLPGRPYGGLRIKDLPHEAQVFADGYYVGIVDDFDGVFQHLNLEAGPHRIEVRMPGYGDTVEFDVVIQPGRTTTYRGDW